MFQPYHFMTRICLLIPKALNRWNIILCPGSKLTIQVSYFRSSIRFDRRVVSCCEIESPFGVHNLDQLGLAGCTHILIEVLLYRIIVNVLFFFICRSKPGSSCIVTVVHQIVYSSILKLSYANYFCS